MTGSHPRSTTVQSAALALIAAAVILTGCSTSNDNQAETPPATVTVEQRTITDTRHYDATFTLEDTTTIAYRTDTTPSDEPQPADPASPSAQATPAQPTPTQPAPSTPDAATSGAPPGPVTDRNADPTEPAQFGGGTTTTQPPAPAPEFGATEVQLTSLATASQAAPSTPDAGASTAPTAPATSAGTSSTLTEIAPTGAVLQPGNVIFRVDNQPTILLEGALPMWRTLDTTSTDGPDIAQLEANLVTLGFGDNLTVDDTHTAATTSAVEAWQTSLGIEPTGIVQLDNIVFANTPNTIAAHHASTGDPVGDGTDIIELSSTRPVVVATIPVADLSPIEQGQSVTVHSATGETYNGLVTTIADTIDGPTTDPTTTITIALPINESTTPTEGHATIQIDTPGSADSLAIPSSAITTTDGQPAVERLESDHSELISVEVGSSSGGWTSIVGPGLGEGDRVVLAPAPNRGS